MNAYLLLKYLHVTSVVLSLSGFVLRGVLVFRDSPRAHGNVLVFGSYLVDTVLLASALGMVWLAGYQPFSDPWLRNKLVGVLVYILLGALAIKRAPTRAMKEVFFVLALIVVSNVVVTALTKNPMGWLVLLSEG